MILTDLIPDVESLLASVAGEPARRAFPRAAIVRALVEAGAGKLLHVGRSLTECLDLPDVRQDTGWSCGAAALQTVAQYFGVGPDDEAKWRELLGTDPQAGTRPDELERGAAACGLHTQADDGMSIDDLRKLAGAGRPVLCPMQADDPAGESSGHWVVVRGVTDAGDVRLHDPVSGPTEMAGDEFLDRWHDTDADGTEYVRYGLAVWDPARELTECGGEGGKPGPCPDGAGSTATPAASPPTVSAMTGAMPTGARQKLEAGMEALRGKRGKELAAGIKALKGEVRQQIASEVAAEVTPKLAGLAGDLAKETGLPERAFAKLEQQAGDVIGKHIARTAWDDDYSYLADSIRSGEQDLLGGDLFTERPFDRDNIQDAIDERIGGIVSRADEYWENQLRKQFGDDDEAYDAAFDKVDWGAKTDALYATILDRVSERLLPKKESLTPVPECGGEGGKPGPCPDGAAGTTSASKPAARPDKAKARREHVEQLLGHGLDVAAGAKDAVARLGADAWKALAPAAQQSAATAWAAGKAIHDKAMIGFHAGKAMVEETAKQRGLPVEHAERVAKIIGIADQVLAWTTTFPAVTALTGSPVAGKAAAFLPMASLGYLAYSTARNPLATVKAARAVMARGLTKHESLEAKEMTTADQSDNAAALLQRLADNSGDEWYQALVAAGLDMTGGDLAQAIDLADRAYNEQSTQTDDEGEDLLECGGEGGKPGPCPEPGGDAPASKKSRKPAAAKANNKAAKPVAEEQPNAKAARAKAAHKMVDKTIQRYAEEHNEPAFAKAMGGTSFPDGEAVDVVLPGDTGAVGHGIELKTMVDNGNNKITMKRSAMDRKLKWERKQKAPIHTVVLDDSAVFNANGEGQHDESKRRIFYRRGVGSFRVNGMHEVKDLAELKTLMNTPNKKLPAAAQRTDGGTR